LIKLLKVLSEWSLRTKMSTLTRSETFSKNFKKTVDCAGIMVYDVHMMSFGLNTVD
jgi:hypothetical protein